MTQPVYFEDLEIGVAEQFGRYEVTAEEIVRFAETFDPQPFHLDAEAAAQSHFGGLIASGWHTCAMMMRMVVDEQGGREVAMASPGFEELRWLLPVRPGDVLSLQRTCVEKRASRSKPDRGIATFRTTVMNQSGEAVATMLNKAIYRRREPG